ncbi:hypothetical protein [Shewanella marisflavi]|uniref:hypothetical protein n=1 Tax=Shewanella marisflavi TaxID=260364 RepID=UPI003AAC2D96
MYLKTVIEVKGIKLSGYNSAEQFWRESENLVWGEVVIDVVDLEEQPFDTCLGTLRLTSVSNLDVQDTSHAFITAYCAGRKPREGSTTRAIALSELDYHDGPTPALAMYPKKITECLSMAVDATTDRLKAIIAAFRWRFNIDIGIEGMSIQSYCGHTRDGQWQWINYPGTTKTRPEPKAIPISRAISQETLGLNASVGDEPTGHQLFREARALADISERATLIMCVAAVEVRLKDLIGYLAPSSEWLLGNLQSPPIDKLFKSYLPTQISDDYKRNEAVAAFGRSAHFKTLKDLVESRNTAVHTGAKVRARASLDQYLVTVEQFLWFCDYVAGFDWAEEYFDDITKQCLSAT